MIKILFVEDDESCAYAVQGGLELFDVYDIRHAYNGKEALKIYNEFCPDVVVSDVEMPIMDGFEFSSAIRSQDKDVVLLLATGLVTPKNVERGYALGIDEYVKKPYIASELHLRIQAILSRSSESKGAKENVDNKNRRSIGYYYILDIDKKTLFYNDNTIQKLTPREADLLMLLLENKNQLVERVDILNQLWNKDDPVFSSRSLDVFVSKLRTYLSKDSSIVLENVRSKGLRLLVPCI